MLQQLCVKGVYQLLSLTQLLEGGAYSQQLAGNYNTLHNTAHFATALHCAPLKSCGSL